VDYEAYLRTPHWRAVRRRYWASKRPKRCAACGIAGVPLDLHHKTYARLGKERLSDLTLMCRPCHEALHKRKRKKKRRKQ
jgi:hypothetical protein